MGEKKKRLQTFSKTYPRCAYCGTCPTASRDHCPPISVFDRRHRPPGLEFPACSECHEGTRQMDLVAAAFSRILRADGVEPLEEDLQYFRGLMNNYPDVGGLFDFGIAQTEILNGNPVYQVPVRDHQRIGRIMNGFAARFGLAMYHEQFDGPAPSNARIVTEWYPNSRLFKGEYPAQLVTAMGMPRTLSAGKNSVHAQFRYSTARTEDNAMFGTFAVFRESFALMAVIHTIDDGSISLNPRTLAPGFLKGFTI